MSSNNKHLKESSKRLNGAGLKNTRKVTCLYIVKNKSLHKIEVASF
jgi:hypothetical protein